MVVDSKHKNDYYCTTQNGKKNNADLKKINLAVNLN